jgi:hypothetical protein
MGDQYYTFSSTIFYTNLLLNALLLNGRYFNLEYGFQRARRPFRLDHRRLAIEESVA